MAHTSCSLARDVLRWLCELLRTSRELKLMLPICSGERLVEELAPELVPMLTALEMPANFVPVTNAVLSEMARRGVSRDKILATLRAMGAELPLGTLRLLQWAQRTGIDVRVLSDCNTLFIGHILTGDSLTILLLHRSV